MERSFDTPGPIELYAELGKGSLTVDAVQTTRTTVTVTGRRAEEVEVSQSGDQIAVIAPRRNGFFGDDAKIDVTVSLPTASHLVTKTGSADQTCTGDLASARVKTGSGDVAIESVSDPSLVEAGSGDLSIDRAGAIKVKSGSGDVRIGHLVGDCSVSTGSGDVSVGTAEGPVQSKSGSGDLHVTDARSDVTHTTGSGDLVVRRFSHGGLLAKTASGDVRVGVPADIPVWTDLRTVSGRLASNLDGAGEPSADQDYLELRASTVSGDIALEQL